MARKEEGALDWRTYGLSFGNRLRHIRELRGLSQEQLANLSGVHRNTVGNLERNVTRTEHSNDPHLSTVFQLAHALDVSPDQLIPNVRDHVQPKSSESSSDIAWNAVAIHLEGHIRKG